MTLKDQLKRTPAWIYLAGLLGAGVVLGLGGHVLKDMDNPILEGLLMAVVVTVALGGSVIYWRRLDEAAREAHKFAWYWGGSAGLALATVAFALVLQPGGLAVTSGIGGGAKPENFVALGIFGTILAQLAGYAVAWIGWWIAKR